MQDPATEMLTTRGLEPDVLSRMVAISLLVHAVGLVALVLSPWNVQATNPDEPVMTISLGGGPGPNAGGMTSMGGRPVQREAPPPPRPEPVRPPAPKTPEMTAPVRKEEPRPVKPPPPPVKTTTPEPRGRTPVTGAQVTPGSAVAQTGATGLDVGLSTGGGGTGGEFDVADFCCPDYLVTMTQLITRQWNPRQGVPGQTTMKFTINRDGSVSEVTLVRSSGFAVLDQAAQRALLMLRMPPLPAAYTDPQLIVMLTFKYQ